MVFFICLKNIQSEWHGLSEVRVRWEGRTEISNNPAAGNYFAGSGTNYSVSLGATVQHRIGPFHRAGEKDQRHVTGTTRGGEGEGAYVLVQQIDLQKAKIFA